MYQNYPADNISFSHLKSRRTSRFLSFNKLKRNKVRKVKGQMPNLRAQNMSGKILLGILVKDSVQLHKKK